MTIEEIGKRRLVVVSNRLPFTVTKEEGWLAFNASAGGLVTGLSGYLRSNEAGASLDAPKGADGEANYVWVGWPGISIDDADEQAEVRTRAAAEFHSYPVFIDEAEMDRFYHGFCNSTIWPLFHYFPSYAEFDEDDWENYKTVNQTFCDAVLEVLQPDDIVWVHDYHLMLLPQMIRERMPDVPIGFFLHIPFPAYEVFRLLPRAWRTGILNGLLGADLVGFHTYDYTQYFVRSVLRVMGYEHNLGQIALGDRLVQADTFPMSIDYAKFHDAVATPEVQQERARLDESLGDQKIVLSIDRLDYSKGIINRLEGYELFLKHNPDWRGKVVLGLVVIPSRVGVNQYQETKTQIEELVGRINGKFGKIHWTPIIYQYRSLPFPELIALYSRSDVGLVTPLRDGMNLIAKEYVAARAGETGVLILSEMAGAATELGEAVLINPTSRLEIAQGIRDALDMPEEEQIRRNRLMQARLRSYTVVTWAGDFITQLFAAVRAQEKLQVKQLSGGVHARLIADYQAGARRLLFLDYDGTLVPFAPRPEQAPPTAEVLDLLAGLAADPANDVVLISGRDKETLESWFGTLPIDMVAEHGVWVRERNDGWHMVQRLSDEWKPQIRPLLDAYAARLPGSFVEEKPYALAWHYRQADPELGRVRAQELQDLLLQLTGNIDVRVLQGNRVLEVKSGGVTKGTTARQWLPAVGAAPFILAVGDDWTDEDLFAVLPASAYSIRVGQAQSHARFTVRDYQDVRRLLADLIGASAPAPAGTGTR
jgi:trehalose 6-phosphate synthase/phosphatase